jgi:hypothetical protein
VLTPGLPVLTRVTDLPTGVGNCLRPSLGRVRSQYDRDHNCAVAQRRRALAGRAVDKWSSRAELLANRLS